MPTFAPKAVKTPKTSRILGHIKGAKKGPTAIIFCGIHGNEMAGVKAMSQVINKINLLSQEIRGNLFAIRGNLAAQLKGQRFLDEDLNRLWTKERIEKIKAKEASTRGIEEQELLELHHLISDIVKVQSPPFYFIDLHTTSSKTLPFLTINDAMINRKFSSLFPAQVVLGIEEYLEGALLSYINQMGYVSVGFESGQHTDEASVENNISFIWLFLFFAGIVAEPNEIFLEGHRRRLVEAAQGTSNFYEITYRHQIKKKEEFLMMNGFESFEKVLKGTVLAKHNGKEIHARQDTVLFMPLYQKQGEDGFFLIRIIPKWALRASLFFRWIRLENLLVILPGISWNGPQKQALLVNTKIARFFTESFFHLLGYRKKIIDKNRLIMYNRERFAQTEMYRHEWWYDHRKSQY
ncbi:MAG: succinylglutamate desuccinylase/aspartoacylase family protein [Maribacter sp.]|nr:succinylglutamate desuccinylase/aspartoacylase family protein [Maribacter sp.]